MPKPRRLPEHLKGRYLERRTHEQQDDAPMTPDDVRRELGWDLIPDNDDIVSVD
jgi:hypothetical protein